MGLTVQSTCVLARGRGRWRDAGSLEDRETKKCQEEMKSKGHTCQAQIDGASGFTQVQFSHSEGKHDANIQTTQDEQHFFSVKSLNCLQMLLIADSELLRFA